MASLEDFPSAFLRSKYPVDLTVPAAGQPVSDVVAGGGVDGCGAGPGREVVAVGEPGDVADLDEQPGSTGRADAVQVEQRRSVVLRSAMSSLFAAFLRW